MSRRSLWVYIVSGMAIAHLVDSLLLGLENNPWLLVYGAYWVAAALALHWKFSKRERASE